MVSSKVRRRERYGHTIVLRDTHGATVVAGVSTYTNGMSAIGIWATSGYTPTAADSLTIQNCTVSYASSGSNIVRRSDMNAAILANTQYPVYISGNTILNNPEFGIYLTNSASGSIQVVENNTLHPNTIVTNGYGIYASNHSRILNNTITTTAMGSSRGIMVENLGSSTISGHPGLRQ